LKPGLFQVRQPKGRAKFLSWSAISQHVSPPPPALKVILGPHRDSIRISTPVLVPRNGAIKSQRRQRELSAATFTTYQGIMPKST
jgi:hypothetical protein